MKFFTDYPKGLRLLFFTMMAERYSYYAMRAVLVLYLAAALLYKGQADILYGQFIGLAYLTPLIGGYIADRYLGNRRSVVIGAVLMMVGQLLMFASACIVEPSFTTSPKSGALMDPGVDNTFSMVAMIAGMAALIIGSGFFKPTLTAMVGDLYSGEGEKADALRENAYTILYMGVNIGAFLGPLVCAFVSDESTAWMHPGTFKWVFLSAAAMMAVSLAAFVAFKDKVLFADNGAAIGLKPAKCGESVAAAAPVYNSPLRLVFCLLLGLVMCYVFHVTQSDGERSLITAATYAVTFVLPVYVLTDKGLSRRERLNIGVIFIITLFSIFFWTSYEQAGSSLTFFAEERCDRVIFSREVPVTSFQSINPLFIVLLAPVMAMLWKVLARYGSDPSATVKLAIGLLIMGLSYFMMAYGARDIETVGNISMWWLVGLYAVHTVAELCLSPIGQSLVYKLSPARMVSLIMGVWFMSSAASGVFSGQLAALQPEANKPCESFLGFEVVTHSDFFLIFAVMSCAAALLLFALVPVLKRMMASVEDGN